ncbi:hypothetical protein EV675_4973 [Pigmentiphaga kullae]|uniref:Uncharacterized protein n=1 Tax=Pigmentiphaga kullae TaxID=151784 RepID=A0A4V2F2J1_9BURK|nr:hypothetical protein EV675_4973 [Pigmentiphaga kullae]
MADSSRQEQPGGRGRAWRTVLACALLGAVLAVAFVGYLRPQLVVGWEGLMALCGF